MEDASRNGDARQRAFDAALDHAAHILPAQGPIGNFVHHNTLHAYQELKFHDALARAHALHDGQGYLSEAHYRAAIASGRIAPRDLERALALRASEVEDEPIGPFTRRALERALLVRGSAEPLDVSLDAPLWSACSRLAPADPAPYQDLRARFRRDRTARDLLLAIAARDPNELSNPILIDLLGAYLDLGMARWSMPGRERGLLACFHALMSSAPRSLPRFQLRALRRLSRAYESGGDARTLSLSLLDELGVSPEHYPSYLSRTLLELPGWSGMVARLEHVPSDREPGAPPASLCELTAARLLLDVEAYATCAREAGYDGPLAELDRFLLSLDYAQPTGNDRNAQALFEVCRLLGLSAAALSELGAPFANAVARALATFDENTRRRLLHEAYEHAHQCEVLDALQLQNRASVPELSPAPRFQVLFCIDDREESIRRYFEELDPAHATYAVAGFFGVAMRFRGIDDATAAALCPVVVEPHHAIEETPVPEHEDALVQRQRRRNFAARVRFEVADSSRSLARGAALTPLLGLFSTLPLTFRVLFPHAAERVRRWASQRALPRPTTRLIVSRDEDALHSPHAFGFTLEEQAERVAGTLENIGLVRDFAPIVAVLGHGATTANNPHHSAYDCGACGGRNGGPNARAFAAMANAASVRERLRARGIDIPAGCWFVGGLHDTTTDAVQLFDVELLPAALHGELASLRAALDRARGMSALERCRKFEHARRTLTPEAALRHVEERAVDLSQARPELGHATNAVCLVGRRALSRGLFLDRRSFLVSYDPEIDPDLRILERVLGAVVPVGAGINLEYYFSTVDNEVWGSGTKLPHNLACLLGVMEGTSGDLRTGLPRQMIEVHDPVRLLTIVEAVPEAILEVASRQPELSQLVTNEWVRLASVHPHTGVITVFERGQFRPYSAGDRPLRDVHSALEWYRGKLGFLAPVRIVKGKNRAA